MQSRIASCVVRSSVEGRSNVKLRRAPFTEYCREGNVTFFPPARRSQTAKPTNFIPLSGPASASKITSASASFPGGLPLSFGMIFTDTSSPVFLDIRILQGRRGPGADGAGYVRTSRYRRVRTGVTRTAVWRVRVDERSLARVHDCASKRPAIGSRPYRRARRNLSHSSRSDHGG